MSASADTAPTDTRRPSSSSPTLPPSPAAAPSSPSSTPAPSASGTGRSAAEPLFPVLTGAQWATMLGSGFWFQLCASGPWSFAFAAWLCLAPLAVLGRVLPVVRAAPLIFGVVFAARWLAWRGGIDDVLPGALVAAAMTTATILAYRHVMREVPWAGSLALPFSVVFFEGVVVHLGWPGLSLWPLSTTQAADVPLWRFVDVLTPLGISFAVAWAQAVLAGWGESWLAEDPWDQETRERAQWRAGNACFWIVGVGLHLGGFLRAAVPGAAVAVDPATAGAATAATAAVLAVLLVVATVLHVRRSPVTARVAADR
jgi:hypothetical protein